MVVACDSKGLTPVRHSFRRPPYRADYPCDLGFKRMCPRCVWTCVMSGTTVVKADRWTVMRALLAHPGRDVVFGPTQSGEPTYD